MATTVWAVSAGWILRNTCHESTVSSGASQLRRTPPKNGGQAGRPVRRGGCLGGETGDKRPGDKRPGQQRSHPCAVAFVEHILLSFGYERLIVPVRIVLVRRLQQLVIDHTKEH